MSPTGPSARSPSENWVAPRPIGPKGGPKYPGQTIPLTKNLYLMIPSSGQLFEHCPDLSGRPFRTFHRTSRRPGRNVREYGRHPGAGS